MNTIINRYIIKTIIPNAILGVSIFTIMNLIRFLYDLIALTIEKDVPLHKTLLLLVYITPYVMTFTIPLGVLMGILLAMGELSANQEIVAMRTNGISLLSIFKPAILFGFFVMILHLLFFQYILPWGNRSYVLTKAEILRKNPALEIASKKQYSEGENDLRIERFDSKTNRFYGVRIVNFKENLLFLAEEGYFEPKIEEINAFPLVLKNVTSIPYVFREVDQNLSQNFYQELRIYIKDFDIQKIIPKGSQMEGILEVIEMIEKAKLVNIVGEMKSFHIIIKRRVDIHSIYKKLEQSNNPMEIQKLKDQLNMLQLSIKNDEKQIQGLRDNILPKNDVYILHQKLAFAASAVLMALLAGPLGLINRRKGKEIAFGIGFVMFVFYESLLTAGNFGWQLGYVSPIFGAWFPNIVVGIIIILITYFRLRNT